MVRAWGEGGSSGPSRGEPLPNLVLVVGGGLGSGGGVSSRIWLGQGGEGGSRGLSGGEVSWGSRSPPGVDCWRGDRNQISGYCGGVLEPLPQGRTVFGYGREERGDPGALPGRNCNQIWLWWGGCAGGGGGLQGSFGGGTLTNFGYGRKCTELEL